MPSASRSASRAAVSKLPGRIFSYVWPIGPIWNGLWPAVAVRPTGQRSRPPSKSQMSPRSVCSTRGARSFHFAGTPSCQRFGGSFTCASASMIG
jgi:hypothetical protein